MKYYDEDDDNRPKYDFYRNRRIPSWWLDYLPPEQNPYKSSDTLTLELGYLRDYWHIHSSNKHPNFKGRQAYNFVQDKVSERFGGAFTMPAPYRMHDNSKHVSYKNAYIGEDHHIHIKDAKQYYEDVISFILSVLQAVSKNHLQSGSDYGGNIFFPCATDAQREAARIERELSIKRTQELSVQLHKYVDGDDFFISELDAEVSFHADYVPGEWINAAFLVRNISHHPLPDKGLNIYVFIDKPFFCHANFQKKDKKKATEVLDIPYCLYLLGGTKETYRIKIPIPESKVSNQVKQKINNLCNKAMEDYNNKHIEIDARGHYPYNAFLDNHIGRLNLIYQCYTGWYSPALRAY